MLNALLNEEIENREFKDDSFEIENVEQANWAFRKIRAYKTKMQETDALADAEIKRIDEWRMKANEDATYSITYFEHLLEQFYKKQKELNPKVKISTPYGKISSRKQQPKWNVVDEVLLHNLKASGLNNLIRVKEEVNKAELKKVAAVVNGNVLIDGEILEGVTVEEQPEAIKIEVEL